MTTYSLTKNSVLCGLLFVSTSFLTGYAQDQATQPLDTNKFIEAQKKSQVPKTRKDAIKLYREAISLIQDGWEERAIDFGKVESKLRDAIRKDKTYSNSYFLLGEVYERQNEWDKAIDVYRDASRESIDKETGFVHLARVYAAIGKTRDAEKVLNSVIEQNKYSAQARAVRASILRNEGNIKSAEQELLEALKQSPDQIKLFKELALVYFQSKRYRQARLALLKALKINESDPEVQNLLGLIHLQEGDREKAVDLFRKAIEADDQAYSPRMNLAAIYLKQGYFQKALEELSTLQQIQPNNVEIVSSIGVAYRGLKKYDLAEKEFERALDLENNYAPALYNLGILHYRHLNDREEAQKYFGRYREAKGQVAASSPEVGDDGTEMATSTSRPQTAAYIAQIENAAIKEKEIKSLEDKRKGEKDRLKQAIELRKETESKYVEAISEVSKIIPERDQLEKEIAAIDKEIKKSRDVRVAAEKDLSAIVKKLTAARSGVSEAEAKFMANEEKIDKSLQSRSDLSQRIRNYTASLNDHFKARRDTDRAIQRLEQKAGINHSPLIDAVNSSDKEIRGLSDKYGDVAKRIDRLQDKRQEAQSRLESYFAEEQQIAADQAANDVAFEKATNALLSTEERIDAFYKEMRVIENKRTKIEGEIGKNLENVQVSSKNRAEDEALFWKTAEDMTLENELRQLDQKREAAGRRLETLEEERAALIAKIKQHANEVDELWQDIQYAGEKWTKDASDIDSLFKKLDQLEDERKQVDIKISSLEEQRKKDRQEVSGILEERKRLESRTSKLAERMEDILKDLNELDKSWIVTLADRDDIYSQMKKTNAAWRKKAQDLEGARLAKAGSLKPVTLEPEFKSLRQSVESFNKQRAALNSEGEADFAELLKVDKEIADLTKKATALRSDRQQLWIKWLKTRDQRLAAEAKRREKDSTSVELIRKRNRLEEGLSDLENKRRKLLEVVEKIKKQRRDIMERERSLQKQFAEQNQARIRALTRDLLGGGKPTSTSKSKSQKGRSK